MSNTPPENPPVPPQNYGTAPTGPDTRPKHIAWTALALGIAGVVAALVGLLPIVWVGLAFAILAGILLLAAFIFSLIGLIGKRNGGKALSVTALVLSIIGSAIAGVALVISLVLVGVAVSGTSAEPAPAVSEMPSAAPTDDGAIVQPSDEATAPAADPAAEAAFLADVRPKINEIMATVDATITPEVVAQIFPDAQLVIVGETLLTVGDSGIDAIVQATLEQSGEAIPAETLRQLYQTILDSAKVTLQ